MSQIVNNAVGYNGMLCECVTNSALIWLRRRQVIAGLIASADVENPTAAAAAEADQAAMYIEVQEFIVGALDRRGTGKCSCSSFPPLPPARMFLLSVAAFNLYCKFGRTGTRAGTALTQRCLCKRNAPSSSYSATSRTAAVPSPPICSQALTSRLTL